MAKNMALVENGIVVNVLWCSDRALGTETPYENVKAMLRTASGEKPDEK